MLTGGLVESNVDMAILNPAPSPRRTFSLGIRTSSNVIPLVSDALCPMFNSFLPGFTPSHSLSTMKPVNALLAGAFGSGLVRANTKYLQVKVRLFFKMDVTIKKNLLTSWLRHRW